MELNPTAYTSYNDLGLAHAYLGEHEAAIENLRKSIYLAPAFPLNHAWLAYMEVARGDPTTALSELQFTEQLMGEHRFLVLLPELAHAYAFIERTQDAKRLFDEVNKAAVGEGRYDGPGLPCHR